MISGGDAPAGGIEFTFVSGGDANGLIYWLGTNDGARAFANPATAAETDYPITNDASGTAAGSPDDTTDRVSGAWGGTNANGNWIVWSLAAGTSLLVQDVTIMSDGSGQYPKNFVIEGSNDLATWTVLYTRSSNVNAPNAWSLLDLSANTESYRHFRFRVTGLNSFGNAFTQRLREVDFYGTYSV